MDRTLTLNSPFINIELNSLPEHWKAILIGWMALWTVITALIIYVYAVVFHAWAGFETAVLVGIALIVLTISNND